MGSARLILPQHVSITHVQHRVVVRENESTGAVIITDLMRRWKTIWCPCFLPFADLPALMRRPHEAAVVDANTETRIFFDGAQHMQLVTRLTRLLVILLLHINRWLSDWIGLLVLFLNFVSKRYEISQETFDPGKAISETFGFPAFDIAHKFGELAAEPLLLL